MYIAHHLLCNKVCIFGSFEFIDKSLSKHKFYILCLKEDCLSGHVTTVDISTLHWCDMFHRVRRSLWMGSMHIHRWPCIVGFAAQICCLCQDSMNCLPGILNTYYYSLENKRERLILLGFRYLLFLQCRMQSFNPTLHLEAQLWSHHY